MAPIHHNYTFYYFPARARGEATRQIFKYANVPFNDVQIGFEEWPQKKEEMPLGQIPVLEVDGIKLSQSQAIMRYLGHQFKLAGTSPIDCARLDMIAETIQDMSNEKPVAEWGRVLAGWIPCDNKEHYFEEQIVPVIEKYAPTIERFLLENRSNGLFNRDRVSWVDIFSAEMFDHYTAFGRKDCLNAYPLLQKHISRVHNEPAIKKHIAQRPPSII